MNATAGRINRFTSFHFVRMMPNCSHGLRRARIPNDSTTVAMRIISPPAATASIDPELLKQVRAGFCAIRGTEPTTAEDLLLRATTALRKAQADDGSFRVRAYDA